MQPVDGAAAENRLHRHVFERVQAGQVWRLPSGETRQYYDDGTYLLRNGIVGVMADAGYVTVGAEDSPPQARGQVWRLVEPTTEGTAVWEAGNG